MSKYPGRIVTDLAPAGYSVAFDGSGDTLNLGAQTAFSFGTGDFTIECWINLSAISANYQCIFDFRPTATNGLYPAIFLFNSTSTPYLYYVVNNSTVITGTTYLKANTWYHIALCRSGTSTRMFLNGVQEGSTYTDSNNYIVGSSRPIFGGNGFAADSYLNGYMSNIRVVKGTALYTAAFTPPTQLFNITNTSLLTCNSPAIIDQSNNAFAITVNGNAAVSTLTPFTAYVPYNPALGASTPGVWTLDEAMQAKATRRWNMYDPYFNQTTLLLHGNSPTNVPTWITDASTNNFAITQNGDARAAGLSPFSLTTFPSSGSGYFDGTGDYLSVPDNAAFALGSGDWTIETYVNFSALPANTGAATFASQWRSGTSISLGWFTYIYNAAGTYQLSLSYSTTGSNQANLSVNLSSAPVVNTWNHVAFVRSGNNFLVFFNGTQVGATQTLNVTIFDSTVPVWIGAQNAGGAPDYQLNGYLSNLRIVKGSAVYISNFTAPTSPLTAILNTSLLTLQNSQSSNNNSFLDSSSNNFLVTRSGNATQGSFSPFSQTGWSNYFPGGNGKYIYAPYNAVFDFGTGDFSVECFAYVTDAGRRFDSNKYGTFVSGGNTVSLSSLWTFGFLISSGVINQLTFSVNGSDVLTASSQSISLNAWHHFVVCRTGTTLSIYVDGTRVATATYSSAVNTNSSGAVFISQAAYQDVYENWLIGNISNVRIIKGTQPYNAANSSITVPTAQLTNITNTSLLTCLSNRFIDTGTANGGNPFTITIIGTGMSVQPFSPFVPSGAYTTTAVGGSGYFDGSGDYLSIADSATLEPGSSNFTIECWVYPTANGSFLGVFSKRTNNSTDFSPIQVLINSGTMSFQASTNGTSWAVNQNASSSPPLNAWSHIAVVRSGTGSNNLTLYLNGTSVATGSVSSTALVNNTAAWAIGADAAAGTGNFAGYISGFRYVLGSTVVPSGAPTTPPTAITDTQLLLNYTNAGIVDSTAKNVLETVGNAQISTTQSKFGGSSMSFDGTTDYVVEPTNVNFGYGTGDFTIEFWLRLNSTALQTVVSNLTSATSLNPHIYIASGGSIRYFTSNADRITGSTLSTNQWYHIAVCRSGTSTRLFIDGTQSGSTYTDSNNYGTTAPLGIGTYWASGTPNTADTLNGYIDDLRITKFARYTGNFTPPTSQFQDE